MGKWFLCCTHLYTPSALSAPTPPRTSATSGWAGPGKGKGSTWPKDTKLSGVSRADSCTKTGTVDTYPTKTGQLCEPQESLARTFPSGLTTGIPNAARPERKEAPESCGILLRVVFGFLSVGHLPPTPPPQFSYWIPTRTFTGLKFLKVCFYLPSLSSPHSRTSHSCSAALHFFPCAPLFSLLSHLHTGCSAFILLTGFPSLCLGGWLCMQDLNLMPSTQEDSHDGAGQKS